MINPNKIILKPVLTEKSLLDQSKGKYSFWVNTKATKNQIMEAFKQLFAVNPISVNTNKIKGKIKKNWKTRQSIIKDNRKKAVITLPAGKKIESLNFQK